MVSIFYNHYVRTRKNIRKKDWIVFLCFFLTFYEQSFGINNYQLEKFAYVEVYQRKSWALINLLIL